MKTAIEELIDYIEEWQPKNKFTDPIWHKAKSLLETEKQQIIDAVKYGFADAHKPNSDINFIHYYENTFNTTNK